MIECECCKTAREFLEKLDLSQPEWSNKNWSSDWIFRGQADADWPLLPAAFRTGRYENSQMTITRQIGVDVNRIGHTEFFIKDTDYYLKLDNSENFFHLLVQLYAEITNLREFFDLGESLSLNNSIPMRTEFQIFGTDFAQKYISNLENEKFMLDLWAQPSIAVAQHHGLATRLLDWTQNPLYAAYFACEGIEKDIEKIAVYATIAPLLNQDIKFIEVGKRHSPYIQAQQGMFTFDTKADIEFLKTGNWRGMEAVPNLRMRKFTLPVQEVNELLRILWLKQITRAHMMPNLDNVILALKTKWQVQLEDLKRSQK